MIRERTYANLLIGLVLSVLIHAYYRDVGTTFLHANTRCGAHRPRWRCNCANGPRPRLPLRRWKR